MNKKLEKYIIEMKDIDQDLRIKLWKPGRRLVNFLTYAVDGIHNYRIRRIIEKYGYPTYKLIGKKAMEAFWLLVQHQDYDVDLQENCLNFCDFNLKNKAFLTDRVKANKEDVQIYGTQFNVPIIDKKNVNKRRKEMGLESLEIYLKRSKSNLRKIKSRTKI